MSQKGFTPLWLHPGVWGVRAKWQLRGDEIQDLVEGKHFCRVLASVLKVTLGTFASRLAHLLLEEDTIV